MRPTLDMRIWQSKRNWETRHFLQVFRTYSILPWPTRRSGTKRQDSGRTSTLQAWTLKKSRYTKNFGHFKGAWKKPGFYLHMIFMILNRCHFSYDFSFFMILNLGACHKQQVTVPASCSNARSSKPELIFQELVCPCVRDFDSIASLNSERRYSRQVLEKARRMETSS